MKLRAAALNFVVAIMLLGPSAWSQEAPKVEFSADYSYSHYGGIDYESPNYFFGQHFNLEGGGVGFVYNFSHKIGFKAEFQGYGNQTRPVKLPAGNPYLPEGGEGNVTGDLFTYMFGPQVSLSRGKFRPFAEGLVGGAHSNIYGNAVNNLTLTGVTGSGSNNAFAAAAGLGFDFNLGRRLSIRPLELDYLYTNFSSKANLSANQNSWRYLGGVVFNFGGKPPIPPTASCSVSPAEIMAGDPVTATMTTQNFNPKHTITYHWTSTGGTASGTAETGSVATTGLAPGSYTVSGTATDTKEKKNNVASCSGTFTVKEPPRNPPVASCSASPQSIAIGQTSSIAMTASSPDGRPLTYNWTADGGQLSGTGASTTVSATNADAGHSITVTGTVSDDRGLTATCTESINVPPVVTCVNLEDWGQCTFEKNPKKPWRVDNDCKDTLDALALRLQQMPSGKIDVVGYTNEEEVATEQTLGAQRAVNVKYYLTTDGPTKSDASRIQPRQGGNSGQATHFFFVPEGTLCSGQVEEGTVVDETAVQGQSRNAPAPKKHKARSAAPPAQ